MAHLPAGWAQAAATAAGSSSAASRVTIVAGLDFLRRHPGDPQHLAGPPGRVAAPGALWAPVASPIIPQASLLSWAAGVAGTGVEAQPPHVRDGPGA